MTATHEPPARPGETGNARAGEPQTNGTRPTSAPGDGRGPDQPGCPGCDPIDGGITDPVMPELTSPDALDEFADGEQPGVVLFHAPWCGPCRMQLPVLRSVAHRFCGRVRAAHLDIDRLPVLADRLEISTLPAFVVFCGGEIVETMIGFQMEPYLEDLFSYLDQEGANLLAAANAAQGSPEDPPDG